MCGDSTLILARTSRAAPRERHAPIHSVRDLVLGPLVSGVNLLLALGPPTWSLLVYARLRWHLDPVLLVVLGAFAA